VPQTLPFLKAAQPGALRPLIENGFTTVDMAAVQAFAQKTLVPMVRSSCCGSAAAKGMRSYIIVSHNGTSRTAPVLHMEQQRDQH
jgi:hypothetical protein